MLGLPHVGEFAKFVKRRNKIAHPSGTVFFNDQVSIDAEATEMMTEVANIQQHMQPIILEVYDRFLVESSNIEEREYADPDQEIEVNLIHRNYVSQKDIEVCLAYDLSKHQAHINFLAIEALHQSLQHQYASCAWRPVAATQRVPKRSFVPLRQREVIPQHLAPDAQCFSLSSCLLGAHRERGLALRLLQCRARR